MVCASGLALRLAVAVAACALVVRGDEFDAPTPRPAASPAKKPSASDGADPVSDEMGSERGLAYRAAYQQYRRGFAEGASGERPRAAPTPPRHTPSPPPLPRRNDRGHASSLVGPLIAAVSYTHLTLPTKA